MPGVRVQLADLLRGLFGRASAPPGSSQAAGPGVAQGRADATGSHATADFVDVPTGDAFDVPSVVAAAYFRAKGLRPTWDFRDMEGEAHDHAFTVAKMLDVDMLAQVKASLQSALAAGQSFGEWKAGIEPILRAGGWWGRTEGGAQLGSAWRLETIFRTNMQTAYSAQMWAEVEENAAGAPFLMYDAVDDFRTRPSHARLDGVVLPAGDPFWRKHTPPLGFGCRCGLIQLSEDDLAGLGITPREPPDQGTYRWTNPRTGNVRQVPEGVDPGFDRNPGQTLLADSRRLLAEKVGTLDPAAAEAVRRSLLAAEAPRSVPGKAAAVVAEVSGQARTAAELDALMDPDAIGYVEAIVAGVEPTRAQRRAFDALPRRLRREVEDRLQAATERA